MDGGKGWYRMYGAQDKSIINRIMLRFRPIAPKPTTGGSATGAFFSDNKIHANKKRTKRKYVRVSKNTRLNKKKNIKEEETKDGLDKTVVTLQLLPEKNHGGKESPAGGSMNDLDFTLNNTRSQDLPALVKDNLAGGRFDLGWSDRTLEVARIRVVESWVTVECVTDTCMEMEGGGGGGLGLGSTDLDRRRNLEVDACPSFISDGYNKVEWVNEAYKRMVMKQQGVHGDGDGQLLESEPEEVVMVGLVIKEKLPPYFLCPAFTCRVRWEYTSGEKKYSLTLPCDTWRMDSGGFAWRLDVKAALSLSL